MELEFQYARDVVVGVVFRGAWSWYVSRKELWFLDLSRSETQDSLGWRFELPVVDETTALVFLAHMEPSRTDRAALARGVAARLLVPGDAHLELLPGLLVDFDRKRLLCCYPEPVPFEKFVPPGWTAVSRSFLDDVPLAERFWTLEPPPAPREAGAAAGAPAYTTGGGRFFCRLCGTEIRSLLDLGMGTPGPPDTFHCPRCEGRALDEYTLLLNLGIFADTHALCPCGAARPLWDRGTRFCFRCGRRSSDD